MVKDPTNLFSQQRQKEIYLQGLEGREPILPASPKALRKKAGEKLSKEAFGYLAGGAGMEDTMSSNRRAFKTWEIVPNMLRDVSDIDTSIVLFGKRRITPFLLAPIGVLELFHKMADLAVARAAAAEQVPVIFSSQASVSMERCAAEMDQESRWFQLYWSKNNNLVRSFVKRAEETDCEAIVLTLDTTMLGWRPRDLDHAYLPFLEARGIAQYVSDPVFREMMQENNLKMEDQSTFSLSSLYTLYKMSKNYPGSTLGNMINRKPVKAVQTFINTYTRPSLEWDDLPFLRDLTELPILLKGVLSGDDAMKALDYGMDGLIVSNHGGRQVDGAVAALEVLPSIVQRVDGRVPVLFDSGIRTGSDIFKALALGAEAVLIGRPYAYALTVAGEAGVRSLIRNLRAEFELSMGLSGCRSVDQLSAGKLRKRKNIE
ncbi:MAG: alpha-hydroxy-acid oxidizing protein [Balneolaceae bacterium]|nr:alpha-hydroxy-acid oxidizing protein [Balneolaceae bacterium]